MFKKIRNKILHKKVKFFLYMHNYSYKKASHFSIQLEKGLHPKHRIMQYHKFFTANINDGDKVLDVGCGNGFNTFCISKKASSIIGIDNNEDNILLAKSRHQNKNIEYIYGDILTYSPEESFDVIVLSNVLEHFEDRVSLLKKLKKLGNKILIRVPVIDRGWIDLYKKELGIEYRLDETHFIEYTLDGLAEELDWAGLKIISYSVNFGEIWAVVGIKV